MTFYKREGGLAREGGSSGKKVWGMVGFKVVTVGEEEGRGEGGGEDGAPRLCQGLLFRVVALIDICLDVS